jgi:hypothetical protein
VNQFDQDTGSSADSFSSTPPTIAGPLTTQSETLWPRVIGIIAIVFGGFGLVCSGWGMFGVAIAKAMLKNVPNQGGQVEQIEAMDRMQPWVVGSSLVALFVAILLLVAGIMLVRRRAVARTLCMSWAGIKIIFAIVNTIVSFMMQPGQIQSAPPQGAAAITTSMQTMEGPIVIFFQLINLAWALALPVFMLIWFNRTKIKDEVATWP